VVFFYRQSPRRLLAVPSGWQEEMSSVTRLNPPPVLPGMAGADLDGRGRLLSLYVIPPPEHDTTAPAPPPDWAELFAAAGLDIAEFRPADPEWNALVDTDLRAAWTGTYPGRPDLPLRVEAGAWRGRPVFFRMIAEAWATPQRERALAPEVSWFFFPVSMAVLAGAVALAARNLWLGRGDRRGAALVAACFLLIEVVGWVVEGGLSFSPEGLDAFSACVGRWSFWAANMAVFYLALEPTVRRRWPWRIVAWGRLLDGRLRDPLVGRDLLVGLAAGTVLCLLPRVSSIAAGWFGPPPVLLTGLAGFSRFGPPFAWGAVIASEGSAILAAMFTFMLAFVLSLVLRKPWLAWGAYVLFLTAPFSILGAEASPEGVASAVVAALIVAVVVGRFGLLATVAVWTVFLLSDSVPLTTDLSAWHAPQGVVAALLVIGLAVYGFVVSVGAKRLALRGLLGEE
jgi:serine/threonine-protein kinase